MNMNTKMKYLVAIVIAAISLTQVYSGKIEEKHIPANVDLLIHLDLDQLRNTQFGSLISKELIDKEIEKPRTEIKKTFDFDLDWHKIKAITVHACFSSQSPNQGALLIYANQDMVKNFLSTLQTHAKNSDTYGGAIKAVSTNPVPIFEIGQDLRAAIAKDNLIVLSKSKNYLDQSLDVILGKNPGLSENAKYNQYQEFIAPDIAGPIFFVAGVKGLSSDVPLPPQAMILKNAEAAVVAFGESKSNVFMHLTVEASSYDTLQNIQQVLQGIIALGTLTGTNNADFYSLAKAASIKTIDNNVLTLTTEMASDKLANKVIEDHNKKKAQKENK